MRRFVLILVVLATVGVGCSSDDGGSESAVPSPGTADQEASVTSTSQDPSALEGTWQTPVVTRAEIEAMLRQNGLEKWIQPLRAVPSDESPIADENVYTLTIRSGNWDLDGQHDGNSAVPIDYGAQYEIDGDTVTSSHGGEGSNTYRWKVVGDTLELTWIETTFGSFEGIPEEVFQRALYETAPFERQS